jgi:hypothetical protein
MWIGFKDGNAKPHSSHNNNFLNIVHLISSPMRLFLVLYYVIRKPMLRPKGIRRTDHVTPHYPQKLALTSPTSGGGSVGIVLLRIKATELVS